MRRGERTRLEARLRAHYAREPRPEAGAARRVAELCAAEARRVGRPRAGVPAFLAAQARFVPRACWLVAAACVALACWAASRGVDGSGALLVMSLAGLALALACLPALVSAKACGMAELEGSCAFNAHAVACARLLVLGGASALALLACALACSALQPLWLLAAHAAAPYLACCAGGLLVARRTSSADAMGATVAWCLASCAGFAVLHTAFPGVLDAASEGLWYAALAVSAAWFWREAALWLDQAARPLEPSPAALT